MSYQPYDNGVPYFNNNSSLPPFYSPAPAINSYMNYPPQHGGVMNGHVGNGSVGLPPARQYAPATRNNRVYRLEVVQQPVRARMCGFGDKDRRPITPPPCVRLIVADATTGEEISSYEDVDSSFFVLCVDLAPSEERQGDVTVVKHSNNSPAVSISAASTTSYPPAPERPFFGLMGAMELVGYYQRAGDMHTAQAIYNQQMGVQGHPAMPYAAPMHMPVLPTPSASMYTRNIIGSLAVNAFKLQDTTGKLGLWFILQDLSIRTEGSFRLKMQFVDVSSSDGRTLTHDKVPILATCFSETFQVYSAKKFPGVIESTALSKTFASQGIKIPIRKDGPKNIPNAADFENDD
jgi:Velvet factor